MKNKLSLTTRYFRVVRWLCVTGSAAFTLGTSCVAQADSTWLGGDNDWDTADLWSPAPPGPLDNVFIEALSFPTLSSADVVAILSLQDQGGLNVTGGELGMTAPSFINSYLLMSGGVLQVDTSLSITGPSNASGLWSGGTISGTPGVGVTTFGGNIQLGSTTSNLEIDGGTVDLTGIATWINPSGGANIDMGNGATLNNSGIFFDTTSKSTTINNNAGGNASVFNNSGTYIKQVPNTTTTISTAFNNTGSLIVQGGTLKLTGGGSNTGSIDVDDGGVLQLADGTWSLSNVGSGAGTGQLLVSGATVNFSGTNSFAGQLAISAGTLAVGQALTAAGLDMEGGTITDGSGLVITGAGTWAAGTITTNTTFQGATTLSGNSDGRDVSGVTLNFTGTTTWSNSPGGDNAFGAINTGDGTILNNTGTWVDANSSDPTGINSSLGGAQGTFNNSGAYIKNGTSTTTISTVFNNASSGSVSVQDGTLALTGGGASSGGIDVTAGAVLSFSAGIYAVSGLGTGTGTGQLLVNGGTVNISGPDSFAGQLAVSAGTLNVSGSFAPVSFSMSGGQVATAGASSLTVTGAATWTSGVISGPGATTFQGSLALSGNSDGREISGGTVNFAGSTTWTNSPGGDNAFGAINTGDGAVLNNTGTWIDASSSDPTSINNSLGGAQGTFNNSGAYIKNGTSTTTISTVFSNVSSGSVSVQAGTLALAGGGASSGGIDVTAGAVLSFSAGTYAVSGLGTGTGTGQLLVNGGSVNVGGPNSFAGQLAVSAGTLNVSGSFTPVSFSLSGGQVTTAAASSLTVTGAATWTSGVISGPGAATFQGPVALSGNSDGREISGGTVNFAGTTTWTNSPGGDNAFGAINTGKGAVLNNTGTLIDANSSDPTSINNSLGGAQGTFNNSGAYIKNGTSTTTISTVFNDTGLLEVDAGALVLGSTLNMSGSSAELALDITGVTNSDLAVLSAAALSGEAALDFDFTPTTGEIITVFDYASHLGEFSGVVALGDAAGLELTPIYNGSDFQVEVGPPLPLPDSFWLLMSGLVGIACLGRAAQRKRVVSESPAA